MKPIREIISSLRIAMIDARQNESHFESWMILNEAICDAIEALAEPTAQLEQGSCGNCNGSGRMPRDPDIGTDQECFVCDGTGKLPKEPEQEPVANMPSNTRYTVEVEGHGRTYWDNIHDAITCAQRAVYSGPENTTRALDDLKAGRFAEWGYGFSAVRIYPPQNTTPPYRKPLSESLVNEMFSNLAKDERTKVFTAENWFQAGLATGEAVHGIKE